MSSGHDFQYLKEKIEKRMDVNDKVAPRGDFEYYRKLI